MAGPTRLELATFCVTGRRSNQTELRSHKLYLIFKQGVAQFGTKYVVPFALAHSSYDPQYLYHIKNDIKNKKKLQLFFLHLVATEYKF